MKIIRIPITTNGDGDASEYGEAANGLLYAIRIDAGDFDSGVDLTLTIDHGDSLSTSLYAESGFDTSKTVYPRVAEQDATDGSDLATTTLPVVSGRPLAVIADGGDTKSGMVILYVLDGLSDIVRVQSVDITRPTVVITSSESSPTSTTPIPITVTFSEGVSGFVVGDLVVGNGTADNFAATDAATYTADVTPAEDGAVTVDVAADVAIDTSGNGNLKATQFSITYAAA